MSCVVHTEPFSRIEEEFLALTTGTRPLAVDGFEIGQGLPDRAVPLNEIIAATANGGRFSGDAMRYPIVEVYGGFSYPDHAPCVHLAAAGPYTGSGEIQGWVELKPQEAHKLANAIQAEAIA